LKAPERVLLQSLEGRAEEILIEIEPNNLQDEEEISVGDEQLKPDQVFRKNDCEMHCRR
jgi:hypothetical protein